MMISKRTVTLVAACTLVPLAACVVSPGDDNDGDTEGTASTGAGASTGSGMGGASSGSQGTGASSTGTAGGGGVGGDPSVTLNFESSFDTALGTSDAALLDGGRWDDFAGQATALLEVVGPENGVTPRDGTGMLRVSMAGEGNAGIAVHDAFDLTEDDQYLRFYVNVQCIDEDVAQSHYVQDFDSQLGLSDSTNFYWKHWAYRASTGRYRMGWSTYASQQGDGNGCNGAGNPLNPNFQTWGRIGAASPITESDDDPNGLECGAWYRVETHVSCLEAGCMNRDRSTPVATYVRMRVYDDMGTQIIGDGQMHSMSVAGQWQSGTPGVTVDEAYDPNGYDSCYYLTSGRPSFHIGNNGQAQETANAEAWMYFDRVAISHEGWVGP